jgi:hypothetical protein
MANKPQESWLVYAEMLEGKMRIAMRQSALPSMTVIGEWALYSKDLLLFMGRFHCIVYSSGAESTGRRFEYPRKCLDSEERSVTLKVLIPLDSPYPS